MIDNIKKHAAPLVAVILAWFCYSSLDAGRPKKAEEERLPEVGAAALPLRGADESAVKVRDPCKMAARRRQALPPLDDTSEGEPQLQQSPDGPFALWLDSILHLPEGGQARICGQTINVGAPVQGLDARSPPVLANVSGSVAGVVYRGTEYRLDLFGRNRLVVERPEDEQPKPPPPPAPAPETPEKESDR